MFRLFESTRRALSNGVKTIEKDSNGQEWKILETWTWFAFVVEAGGTGSGRVGQIICCWVTLQSKLYVER